jgi:hypothetical protein
MRLNERVDEEAELAELQRRAYGPAGDIDPEGARRLAELQERERRRRADAPVVAAPAGGAKQASEAAAPVAADAVRRPAPDPDPAGPPASAFAAPAAPWPVDPRRASDGAERDREPGDATTPGEAPAESSAARRFWSRPAVLLAAGAAAGMLVAAAIVTAVAAGGAPDAELRIVDDEVRYGLYGLGTDGRAHEEYHGVRVESSRTPDVSCLSVVYDVLDPVSGQIGGSMGTMDCAPPGATPTASVWAGESPMTWGSAEIDGLESGTFVRFELHGDVVEVWRSEPAPTPAPDQAQ